MPEQSIQQIQLNAGGSSKSCLKGGKLPSLLGKKKKKGEREEWMTKQSFEFVLVTIRYKIHCKVKIPTVIAPAFCRQ